MDDLTRMVLRYLQWPQSGLNERPTYWAMAKGLGVSPRAVKARLDLLVPRGVVKKFRIVIEPSCLGLKESIISVQCTNTFQDKLASKISLFDFIETVHLVQPLPYTFLGKSSSDLPAGGSALDKYAVLHLFHRGEGDLKRELELVKEVCGDFTVVRTLQARCQTSVRSLNVFDLRILDLLRSDPFMKITSIAEMLGCSRRRVRNRLKTLASLKIFQIEPVINTGAITGSLVAIIAAIFNESDRARIDARLDSLLNDRCFQLYRNVVGSSTYFCTFESNQELTSLHEVLSKSGLVKEVGVAYSSETLDNTLAIPIM